MVKGMPWTHEEVKLLLKLVAEGKPLGMIAAALGKSEDAVYHKCKRLGLKVKEEGAMDETASIKLPQDLPSLEEALKILAGALQAAVQAGLSKVEVQRLQAIATLAKTYEQLLSKYVDYRAIEEKLLEMEQKYSQLLQKIKSETTAGNEVDTQEQ